jgi:hypothetical protein
MNSTAQDALKTCPSYYESDATYLEQLENVLTDCECPVEKLQDKRRLFELAQKVMAQLRQSVTYCGQKK